MVDLKIKTVLSVRGRLSMGKRHNCKYEPGRKSRTVILSADSFTR